MTTKFSPQRYFWIVLIALLAACGKQAGSVTPTATQAPTFTPIVETPTIMPADSSRLPTIQFSTLPPAGQIPTATLIPTSTPPSFTPAPTRTPLPFRVLEGLRVAYTSNGNLYVQDSGKPAIQLTDSGRDSNPLLSDDGKRIAFYRGRQQVRVIRVGGTGEQVLVSRESLSTFGDIYDNEFIELHNMAFLPGTHQLLFNTLVYPRTSGESHPGLNEDLFFVDVDTGKLRQFKAPRQGGNFLPAPNGKWIAVETLDHIEVINTQGQPIHRNLVTYPTVDDYYGLDWAPMFWTRDSRELIVVQPAAFDEFSGVNATARSVWRYSLNSGEGVETRLNPPPMNDALSVSPDGNWIAYSYELGRTAEVGVYLGNLRDGTSQLIYTAPVSEAGYQDVPLFYDDWSPDSVHFIFRDMDYQMFLGNIHGETVPLGRGAGLEGWIDNTHYLFEGGEVIGEVGTQEKVNVMGSFPYYEVSSYDPVSFVFLGR